MTIITDEDFTALNDRLQVAVGTSTRQRGQINALKYEVTVLKGRLDTAETERDAAKKERGSAEAELEQARKQLSSISNNLQKGWGGLIPRGGLKDFLKDKGASERVRAMCNVHVAFLAEKWWRHMKIMPENWQQFSKDRNSVPMRMMYDLRDNNLVFYQAAKRGHANERLLVDDLSTPMPHYGFPGLQAGDRWCLCLTRWLEALQADAAPKVVLESTHERVLSLIDLETLKKYAVDEHAQTK